MQPPCCRTRIVGPGAAARTQQVPDAARPLCLCSLPHKQEGRPDTPESQKGEQQDGPAGQAKASSRARPSLDAIDELGNSMMVGAGASEGLRGHWCQPPRKRPFPPPLGRPLAACATSARGGA